MKPFILISPSYDDESMKYCLSKYYAKAISDSGGISLLTTYENIDYINQILDKVDGVLFSGGGDIHAKFFNEELDINASSVNEIRDEFEIRLCKEALKRDMPLLCICRGIQILNVVNGGKIIQHIENHNSDTTILMHNIDIVENSYFHNIYDKKSFKVNSIHHQAIKNVSDNVEILAKCKDTIEAIKFRDKKFVLGVQYHPERIYDNIESKILFDNFIKACSK